MLAWLNTPLDLQFGNLQLATRIASWPAQLADLAPRWLLAREVTLDVRVEREGYVLAINSATDSKEERFASPELLKSALDLQQARARELRQTAIMRLVLPGSDFISRVLRLPAQARRNLSAAAELQVDTQTPFSPRDVHVSVLASDKAANTGHLDIEMVIVPKRRLQERLERCAAIGLQFDEIIVASTMFQGAEHTIIARQDGTRTRLLWALVAGCAFSSITLAVIAVCAPLVMRQELADAIENEAAAKISAAAELDAELDGVIAQLQILRKPLETHQAAPSMLKVLRTLTDVTGDDTFLERFYYRDGAVEISGLTSSTSGLIEQIGQTKLLSAPTYLAPVSLAEGKERFNLLFKLAPTP